MAQRFCERRIVAQFAFNRFGVFQNGSIGRCHFGEFAGNADFDLERLVLQRTDERDRRTVEADGLFVFIGAEPRTQWLEGVVDRDEQGFIVANERMETSVPGVFVAGDVRAGSVKRIASAVGEGAMAVQFIHGYLADR